MASRRCYPQRCTVHVSRLKGLEELRVIYTLARKFDAVHKKTVTNSRNMPNVLRAIFCSPTPARKPPGFNEVALDEGARWTSGGMVSGRRKSPAFAAGTGLS